MPIQVNDVISGDVLDASALIGNYATMHVKVDVSALTNTQVDAKGYLKPNVVLDSSGKQIATASSAKQAETATAAGTASADGIANVTVTSNLLAGGSLVVPVAIANADTATLAGGKIRAALQAIPAITQNYDVTGTTTAVILTALVAAANDASLNIAIDTGTATGITAVPESADTNAGIQGSTDQVPVVTVESVQVAKDNSASLATSPDVFVACAVRGELNRHVMEDVLGRVLLPTEISALRGPNSNFTLYNKKQNAA